MKRNYTVKGLIVVGLTFLLLIPTLFIGGIISEREVRQQEAFREISSKWAETQTVVGPVVSIPYIDFFTDSSNVARRVKRYIHILPDKLDIKGAISPETRHRGIFEIVVYASKLSIKGSFSDLSAQYPSIPKENILYNQAFVSLGITDLRGIEDNVNLKWGDSTMSFNPGVECNDLMESGISAKINLSAPDSSNKEVNFSFDLNLKGSQYLYFTPVGKETKVDIASAWPSPKFNGAFLPDTSNVKKTGFNATWKILHLNRNFPQRWFGTAHSFENSSFGIDLLLPVDGYTKTDRAIKYAILFIGLTFLIFYFLELLNNKLIHPLQYILVGFALCLFYILLLSISEHLNFNIAYIISSILTIGLIYWYAKQVLGEPKLSALVGGNLLILYSFIFTLLQIEDYALLMGSIGLFVILAIVMHYSRKIDWNGVDSENAKDKLF